MTQREMERLVQESSEISSDWEAYLRFRETREKALKNILTLESDN